MPRHPDACNVSRPGGEERESGGCEADERGRKHPEPQRQQRLILEAQ